MSIRALFVRLCLVMSLAGVFGCSTPPALSTAPVDAELEEADRAAMVHVAARLDALARAIDSHQTDTELDPAVLEAWLTTEGEMTSYDTETPTIESFEALLNAYAPVLGEVATFDGDLPDDVQRAYDDVRIATEEVRPADRSLEESLGEIRVQGLRERRCCVFTLRTDDPFYGGDPRDVIGCDGITATRVGAWIYCNAQAVTGGYAVQIVNRRCRDLDECGRSGGI